MPNRYLRASYIESETVNKVSLPAEVLWTRLLVTVDDWGRTEANVRVLRPKLFPLRLDQIREADLQRLLAECEKAGLVRLYTVDGKAYLEMQKWEKGRAEKSRYPDPPPTDASGGKHPPTVADNCLQPSTDAPDPDPDPDNDNDPDNTPKPPKGAGERFVPPTQAEVELECARNGLPQTEAVKFVAFYESKGWMVGKTKMKSWRGALAGWRARWEEHRNGTQNPSRNAGGGAARHQPALCPDTAARLNDPDGDPLPFPE